MHPSAASNIAVSPTDVNIPDPKLDDPGRKLETKMAQTNPHSKQSVPPEILNHILELMIDDDAHDNKPTIISIGLTAHVYWDFLKTKYPMQKLSPISSCFQSSPYHAFATGPFLKLNEKRQLTTMLKTWVGPDYRPVSETFLRKTSCIACQIMFLRRDTYGDEPDVELSQTKEKDLIKRLRLWRDFPVSNWPSNIPFRSPMLRTLPNPYGMGMEWYPTAARDMKNMMCYWGGYDLAGLQDEWDDAQFILLSGYHGTCLWRWVHKDDEKDVPETKILKEQLREFEVRILEPIVGVTYHLDEVMPEWR
ncbi:hypothetical protein SBOR_3793 [Sclerotinia borealis F-4128]|uniref:Uncharacterized protein n=1 Tax=Sclerotinia borealis (strain F-4128) TaxID=1432307 RepID=W9CIT3_SCLBF|nr:hypothetical protein SBOR_3793 [Sclerotinia borealis F-4128]